MIKIWEVVRDNEDIKVEIASSRPIKRKIGSDLIMWEQDTDYSHVLVIINDMVFQASHGYANAVTMSHFLSENLIVSVIEIDKEKCDLDFLFSNLGKKYGYMQIIEIAVKFILLTKLRILRGFKYKDNGNQSLICSEYVGKFLKLSWVNDLTSPQEIISYLLTIKK